MYLFDELNHSTIGMTPDPSSGTTGGYFYVSRNDAQTGFVVDGNYIGSEEPSVSINGSTRSAAFNMYNSGNNSVILPQDVISSSELSNEPGAVSFTEGVGSVTLTTAHTTIASQSITVPTDGYVLVIGTCQGQASHTTGTNSAAEFGVSDVSNAFPDNQDVLLQVPPDAGSGTYCVPTTCTGLFDVAVGTHTLYFLGRASSGSFAAFDIQFSIIFIPTTYGTVKPTLASGASGTDDGPAREITDADVAAQRAASEETNIARLEREIEEIHAELDVLKASDNE